MSSPLRALALTCLALSIPAAAHAQTGVSDDRVSLPEGPGSLEGIGDDVSVNPNMGQMSTSVPIEVPDAWGMAPALGLNYSSGAGGSVGGLGWSLEIPSIERLTLRGVPRYTVDDEFSIGGSGQLVYVGGSEPRRRAAADQLGGSLGRGPVARRTAFLASGRPSTASRPRAAGASSSVMPMTRARSPPG